MNVHEGCRCEICIPVRLPVVDRPPTGDHPPFFEIVKLHHCLPWLSAVRASDVAGPAGEGEGAEPSRCRSTRRHSPTDQACAMQPRGAKGASASKISEIEPRPASRR